MSSAPGPAQPDRLAVSLDSEQGLQPLATVLDQTVPVRRPWLGVQLIDVDAHPHPLVVGVTPGSPAEHAGLRLGDQIASVSSVPVLVAQGVEQQVEVAEIGEPVVFGVLGSTGSRTVRVTLGSTPVIIDDRDPALAVATGFAALALLEARTTEDDRWIVQLNRAKLLLRAGLWVDAARALRGIEAPASATGVGQATVDYWLGVALIAAGPSYRESAIAAFERAAQSSSARLFHHDGPFVAPRAAARLRQLAGDVP